jgi:hypothetical protein
LELDNLKTKNKTKDWDQYKVKWSAGQAILDEYEKFCKDKNTYPTLDIAQEKARYPQPEGPPQADDPTCSKRMMDYSETITDCLVKYADFIINGSDENKAAVTACRKNAETIIDFVFSKCPSFQQGNTPDQWKKHLPDVNATLDKNGKCYAMHNAWDPLEYTCPQARAKYNGRTGWEKYKVCRAQYYRITKYLADNCDIPAGPETWPAAFGPG